MIRLIHGDCMDFMKDVPDKAFDLAIVDPPYGIKISNRATLGSPAPFGGKKNKSKIKSNINPTVFKVKEWDNFAPPLQYFIELQRVSKNQIMWGANHYISKVANDSPCWIVWDKETTADYADAELAYSSFKTAVRIFKFKWSGCLQENMKNKETRIHPTQKPVQLYKWLLKNYAKEGDKILDTHGGSLSSVIACIDGGFDMTCIELDEDYFKAGVQRVQNHVRQLDMYQPRPEIIIENITCKAELL